MKLKTGILLLLSLIAVSITAQDQNDYIRRSAAKLNNGQFSDAAGICNEALRVKEDYRLYLILADAQLAMGLSIEAEDSFRKASGIAEGAGDYGLAIISADRNDALKLVYHLEKHLRSPFKKTESEIMLNEHFYPLQSSDEWKDLWKRSWYTSLEKGLSEASYLEKSGRLEELQNLEKDLLPVYRDEAAMEYLEGMVRMALGDVKGAQGKIREALNKGYTGSGAYLDFIDVLIKDRNYAEAVSIGEKANELFPMESVFILKLAEANRLLGDRDRAADLAKSYLDLYPESEEGLSLAGRILNEKRSYTEALKCFTKSIDLYPGNADHYVDRADVYSRTQTWQYAISDYSMALDLRPGDGDVYYRKANALLKMGKLDDACRDFKMALKYGNKKAASEINKHCIR